MRPNSTAGHKFAAFLVFCVGVGLLFIPVLGWGLGPIVILGSLVSVAGKSAPPSLMVCPSCGYAFARERV